MTEGSIYLVTHKASGKKYVGQHGNADPRERWEEHIKSSRYPSLCIIHKAIKKYGKDAFTWEVLTVCPHSALDNMEAYWAEQMCSYIWDSDEKMAVAGGYNMVWCGRQGARRGIKHRPDVIARFSASLKGKSTGDRNGTRLHPESLNRGDDHHARLHPERLARGNRHGSKTHPEKLKRGDNHYSRTNPELLARGDRNGTRLHPESLKRGDEHHARLHPERLARGEANRNSSLTPNKVRIIRIMYSSGHKITLEKLGAMFDVTYATIAQIIHRKTWAHIQ